MDQKRETMASKRKGIIYKKKKKSIKDGVILISRSAQVID